MNTKPSEIEFRELHQLQPEVKARLEILDRMRIRLAYVGVSTWTIFNRVDDWDVPTVTFYSARRRPIAEWNPVNGKGTSIGQAKPYTFTTKNVKVLVAHILKMARRVYTKTHAVLRDSEGKIVWGKEAEQSGW